MRKSHSARRTSVWRLAAEVAGITVTLALLASPVQAAAPNNDEAGDALTIASVPYTTTLNTSEATVGPEDSGCGLATVWYAFTPDTDGTYAFDTVGSDYDTTLAVLEGSPGSLSVLACNDDALGLLSALLLQLQGGTTYYIEAGTCCGSGEVGQVGSGGMLVLNVGPEHSPFSVELAVDRQATIGSTPGTAIISGTVTCNQPGFVDIYGDLRQKQGLNVVRGDFYASSTCSSTPTAWTATVDAGSRVFLPKKATVNAQAYGCDPFTCDSTSLSEIVRLTRK
jgi:hypothetical protein